jgi:hypothetical protein
MSESIGPTADQWAIVDFFIRERHELEGKPC